VIVRLFVYGTLREGAPNDMSHMLAPVAALVGPARVRGRLLDLGRYPGMVPGAEGWVRGEVHRLSGGQATLDRLDAYEGCGPDDPKPHEFERIEAEAVLDAGERARVWVYVYRGSARGRAEIASGDYLDPAGSAAR
jgi:gamma-glutamylcyclotransferase (GGCT)/AIG2-like uncharacterized protein YtfP